MSIAFPVLDGASCVDVNPEWFFPPKVQEAQRARQMARLYCATCPVVDKCLTWAVESEDELGIWAGTTPDFVASMSKTPSGLNDAFFIAAARTDVPAMVAALRDIERLCDWSERDGLSVTWVGTPAIRAALSSLTSLTSDTPRSE